MSEPISFRVSLLGMRGERRVTALTPAGAALMMVAELIDDGDMRIDALVDVKRAGELPARFEVKADLRAGGAGLKVAPL